MNEQEALSKMVAPGQRRQGKPSGGVIQIWVTRVCDKSCVGCTQAGNITGPTRFITPSQFEEACLSLQSYFGVVGMFGGNPCLHPNFPELCDIMANYIPKARRGLWANKLFGHGAVCRQTFNPAVSNLNVHLDAAAYDEFKRDWPEAGPFGLDRDSRHAPVYTAMIDLLDNEEERWDLISSCDINQHWSAMVGVFRGELRGYFCEIAGAQAMLHQDEPTYPNYGVPIDGNWWRLSMMDFADQVRFHCHRCGVPLRGRGSLSQSNDPNQVTKSHANVYTPKGRRLKIVTDLKEAAPGGVARFVKYLQNGEDV